MAGPELELLRRLGILSAKASWTSAAADFAEKLRSAVDGVIGVDVDAAMIELATRRPLERRVSPSVSAPDALLDDGGVDVYARFLQHPPIRGTCWPR